MINMAVGEKHSIDLPEQVTPLPEQMNARFPGIKEQMLPLQKKEGTGEKPFCGGKAGTGAEETEGGHSEKLSPPTRKARQNPRPAAGIQSRVKKPLFTFDRKDPFS
jgi:hypothetical protein